MVTGCENIQEFISTLSIGGETQQASSSSSTQPNGENGSQQLPQLPPATIAYYPAQNPAWAKLDIGALTCKSGEKLYVRRADVGNSIDVTWAGKEYTLNRVKTESGAFRYEDSTSGFVFIQVPAKVQLLNSKLGQRVADDCRP